MTNYIKELSSITKITTQTLNAQKI